MNHPVSGYVVYVLVAGLTCLGTAGCQLVDNPLGPDFTADAPTIAAAPPGCPTVEDLCDDIGPAVFDACGDPESYAQYGDYVHCRSQAISDELSMYDGCFSNGELQKIAACVRKWIEEMDAIASPQRRSKLDYHSEPATP
jgi:hypothetical protein